MEFDTQSIWYIVYAITFLAAAIIIYFLYLEIVDLKKKVNAQANASIRAQAVDSEAFENNEEFENPQEVPGLGSFEFEHQSGGAPDGHFISLPRNVIGAQHIVVDQNGNHFIMSADGNAHAIPSGVSMPIPVHGQPQIVQMQEQPAQIEEVHETEGVEGDQGEKIEDDEVESSSKTNNESNASSTSAQPTNSEGEGEEIPEEIEIVIHPQTPSASYVEKCKKILTVGKNKGNECGKIAVERGLCRNHAAFAS